MKKIFLIIGFLVSSALLWQSCTKEGDPTDEGDTREAFIGNWAVNDQCSKQTYGVSISLDGGNSSQVIIANYANLGNSAKAIVAGSNIQVESQDIGNGYSVSGNGTLNGEIISWSSYNFETDSDQTECTATFSK
jgi:hypothetical protein